MPASDPPYECSWPTFSKAEVLDSLASVYGLAASYRRPQNPEAPKPQTPTENCEWFE